ncbi:transcriptional regulator [Sorangium cellulosum]|uniref:Transcriptional regulator n=1 Tax=Sorangium cellulosum TaxID=56 RepID=A0A2L0EQ74_SORCE|nr:PTS sugar transporter subunit IIA [Sorangium cellulosum]AUX41430.1 transcriptional regulator [Sorangium cellulosum]
MAAASDIGSASRARSLAEFGAALRLLRVEAGLSLRALAQRIGVSSAYLSRVEHGHDAIPTPDRLTAIASALGLPPALLLELGHQVEPLVARYLERVPAANALFLDIARRRLTGPQLARVKAFIDAEFPPCAPFGAASAQRLSALLTPERIVLHLSCAHLEDVIDVAASRLAPPGGAIAASALAQEILRRERESPTALGNGVAVPHAILPGACPAAVLATLVEPLAVPTPGGAPLRLIAVIVSGEGGRAHLELLAQVARLAIHDAADALCAAESPAQLIEQLAQLEAGCG